MTTQSSRRYRRWAWVLIVAVAGFMTMFGVFVLFSPINANDFERETSIDWADFSTEEPVVANYLEREGRIVAAVSLGFGVMTLALAAGPLRRGERGAWRILWIFVGGLALITVVFYLDDAPALGSYYLLLSASAAIALVLSTPSARTRGV